MTRTLITCMLVLLLPTLLFSQGSSIATAVLMAPNSNLGSSMTDNSHNHYWKMTTTSDGYWRIQVASSALLDVDVTLYDSDATSYIAGDSETGPNSEVFAFVKSGTYYLYCYRGSGSTGTYSVTSTFLTPSRPGDTETNDLPSSALTLNPTSFATGHLGFFGAGSYDLNDYWKITTTQDGWLRIQIRNDTLDLRGDNAFDVDVTLLDVNGTGYIAGDSRTGTFSEVSAFLRPGTYYVRAYKGIGRAGSYEIRSDFFTAPRTNDPEGNDSYQTASSALVNSFVTGHLGYFSNGTTDMQDYWKFTLTGDGKVVVQIANDSLDQSGSVFDVDFAIYDSDGSSYITGNSSTGSFSEATTYLKGGTYYVRAYKGIGNAGTYALTIKHTPPPLADDGTGNETLAGAKALTYGTVSTGHVGYYGGGATNTQDYWKVVAPATDTIYIHILSDPDVDVDFSVTASDGVSYITGDSKTGIASKASFKATAGNTYYVRAYRGGGNAGSYSIVAQRSGVMVGIEERPDKSPVPSQFVFEQNYPNPFNPSTTIQYELPESQRIRVSVYSLLGQEIAELVNTTQSPGNYRVVWNGKDLRGTDMPSGMYMIRLQAGNTQLVRKALLVR